MAVMAQLDNLDRMALMVKKAKMDKRELKV